MFTIEMLPAREGDALWVEYGDPDAPHRLLIDCGYRETYEFVMKRLRADPDLSFELLILTHIDNDHLTGAVPLIRDGDVTTERIQEVWFNGREHIRDLLGVVEAELFTNDLKEKGFRWNEAFGGGRIAVPDGGPAEAKELEGGMKLTLLSPGIEQLRDLAGKWSPKYDRILEGGEEAEKLERADERLQPDVLGEELDVGALAAQRFSSDKSLENGSSIAVLAEYVDEFDGGREKAALFAGDSFSPVVADSLRKLLAERGIGRLSLDALKVSHHGSRKNTDVDVLGLVDSRRFLFSTDGSGKSRHPNPECIARILTTARTGRIELCFNFVSESNSVWESPRLQHERQYNYDATYPADTEGLTVTL